jgi:hypothetical protein
MKSKMIGVRAALTLVASLALSGIAIPVALADGIPHAQRSKKMATNPTKANGSGISVSYKVEGVPKAGQTTSISLSFTGVRDPAGATVRLVAESGLILAGNSTVPLLNAGEPTPFTVEVTPGEGIGYLHVFTTQFGITSVTSIAVQTGKVTSITSTPNGELKQSPKGDKILTMPVK